MSFLRKQESRRLVGTENGFYHGCYGQTEEKRRLPVNQPAVASFAFPVASGVSSLSTGFPLSRE